MATQHSDAFVFFGATGDLAYKQVFSALQAMTRRGYLDMPVIGVAKCDGPTLCHGGRQTAHSGGDEKDLGGPATTVWPRQGHYALDSKAIATYPPADLTIERIGDLVNYDLPALQHEDRHVSPQRAGQRLE